MISLALQPPPQPRQAQVSPPQTNDAGQVNNRPVTNTIYLVSNVNGFGSVFTGTNTSFTNPGTAIGRIYSDDITSFDLSGAEYQGLETITFQLRFSELNGFLSGFGKTGAVGWRAGGSLSFGGCLIRPARISQKRRLFRYPDSKTKKRRM
jgi:hypothetical protein